MPAWLLDLFASYGYAVVFAGVFLENAGLPVPGETTLLAGAALAHFGQLSFWWVVVVATIGAACGDNLGFYIGRRGGRRLVERYGARLGITRGHLATFDGFFERHGPKAVFVARFITGLRVIGAILAGSSAMRWPAFLFYNTTGAIVWSTTIAFAGYSLAYSWETLERWIGRSGLIALAAVMALGVVAYLRARRLKSS